VNVMPTKIVVKNNGSLKVEGDFEIYDMQGNRFDLNGRTAASFCRCGASKDMPFCDSTHKQCGFKSEVVARVLPPTQPKTL